jgi:hypothetical protein
MAPRIETVNVVHDSHDGRKHLFDSICLSLDVEGERLDEFGILLDGLGVALDSYPLRSRVT